MKQKYRVLIMPTPNGRNLGLVAPFKTPTLSEWVDRKTGNGSHLIGFTRNTNQSNFILIL